MPHTDLLWLLWTLSNVIDFFLRYHRVYTRYFEGLNDAVITCIINCEIFQKSWKNVIMSVFWSFFVSLLITSIECGSHGTNKIFDHP